MFYYALTSAVRISKQEKLTFQYLNSSNEQIKFHTRNPTDKSYWFHTCPVSEYELHVLYGFLVTVKAAPHECVIRTGLP